MNNLLKMAKKYHAHECVDKSEFQRKARILQAIWRKEKGYPVSRKGERVYGARLEMPWAEETLSNYMSDVAKAAVHKEVLSPERDKGKLYSKPRIFNNLLSSQPLCFNLFAEVQQNLELATSVVQDMGLKQVENVTAVEFELSPGRGDPEYTGDRSAFDVFVEYRTNDGKSGFLGIEVKYHENLLGEAASHRERYDEVALMAGCFKEESLIKLRSQPLQQIWRDHLLACSVIQHGDYDEGAFVFLYPEMNLHCRDALAEYAECLVSDDTFKIWTLKSLVDAIQSHPGGEYVESVRDRYLNFGKVEEKI